VTPASWTLRTRLLLGSAALAIVIALVFYVLLHAMSTLRSANEQERHAKELTSATLVLQKSVAELDTALRAFAVTHNDAVLKPLRRAQAALPMQLSRFEALAGPNPSQRRQAERLTGLIRLYQSDYTQPLLAIARADPAAAASDVASAES
jgi:CHASE3 domain sensor protein